MKKLPMKLVMKLSEGNRASRLCFMKQRIAMLPPAVLRFRRSDHHVHLLLYLPLPADWEIGDGSWNGRQSLVANATSFTSWKTPGRHSWWPSNSMAAWHHLRCGKGPTVEPSWLRNAQDRHGVGLVTCSLNTQVTPVHYAVLACFSEVQGVKALGITVLQCVLLASSLDQSFGHLRPYMTARRKIRTGLRKNEADLKATCSRGGTKESSLPFFDLCFFWFSMVFSL